MNTEDTRILENARIWDPFGGPRMGDVFVNFGMTPQRYFSRIEHILRNARRMGVSANDQRVLERTLERLRAPVHS